MMDEACMLGSDALLQSCTACSRCKSNLCWKPWLTSSCQSNVDSVCVQCSQAIANYSRSHGWSQLVLCPHPLTLPSNVWKTCPKVCWSMQLIYCPYKCNTTNIQETPRVATVDHLTVTLYSGWCGFSLFILNNLFWFLWHICLWFINCKQNCNIKRELFHTKTRLF